MVRKTARTELMNIFAAVRKCRTTSMTKANRNMTMPNTVETSRNTSQILPRTTIVVFESPSMGLSFESQKPPTLITTGT